MHGKKLSVPVTSRIQCSLRLEAPTIPRAETVNVNHASRYFSVQFLCNNELGTCLKLPHETFLQLMHLEQSKQGTASLEHAEHRASSRLFPCSHSAGLSCLDSMLKNIKTWSCSSLVGLPFFDLIKTLMTLKEVPLTIPTEVFTTFVKGSSSVRRQKKLLTLWA